MVAFFPAETTLTVFEQFLRSRPINPAGFKIALELLLKTPNTSSGLAEFPYSFGKRQIGESKLGVKVIYKYVGQLLALYRWAWGLFFPVVVFVLATGGSWGVLQVLDAGLRRYGDGQMQSLGRRPLTKMKSNV